MRCETCLKAGKLSTYAGETGRNGYSREREHLDALRLEDDENSLWKHCLVEHGGNKAEFSMKVVGRYYSCLVRQINEAGRIEMSEAECVMNSKSEFPQSPLVRIKIKKRPLVLRSRQPPVCLLAGGPNMTSTVTRIHLRNISASTTDPR